MTAAPYSVNKVSTTPNWFFAFHFASWLPSNFFHTTRNRVFETQEGGHISGDLSRSRAGGETWVGTLKKSIELSWKDHDVRACGRGNGEKGKHRLASNKKKRMSVSKQGPENRDILVLYLSSGSTYVNRFFSQKMVVPL